MKSANGIARRWRMLACIALVAGAVLALVSRPQPVVAQPAGSKLQESMQRIGEAFKTVRRQVRMPEKNEDTLRLLSEFQRYAVAAKSLTPAKASEMPEKERAAFVKDYRVRLISLLEVMLKTEKAVLEGDPDKAYELLKEAQVIKSDAHRDFQVDGD